MSKSGLRVLGSPLRNGSLGVETALALIRHPRCTFLAEAVHGLVAAPGELEGQFPTKHPQTTCPTGSPGSAGPSPGELTRLVPSSLRSTDRRQSAAHRIGRGRSAHTASPSRRAPQRDAGAEAVTFRPPHRVGRDLWRCFRRCRGGPANGDHYRRGRPRSRGPAATEERHRHAGTVPFVP